MVLPAHRMPRLKTKFLRSTVKFFLTIVIITWVFQHTVVRNDSSRSWMKFSDQNCNIQQVKNFVYSFNAVKRAGVSAEFKIVTKCVLLLHYNNKSILHRVVRVVSRD